MHPLDIASGCSGAAIFLGEAKQKSWEEVSVKIAASTQAYFFRLALRILETRKYLAESHLLARTAPRKSRNPSETLGEGRGANDSKAK